MRKCLGCGNDTKNAKFCSRSCSATVNNTKFPKRKLSRVCNIEGCDKIVYTHRHRLCEEHHLSHKEFKYKNRTIGEYRNLLSVRGKHPSWVSSHIRLFARSWNKEMRNECCRNCGYKLHVELCHIKDVSSFDDDALLSDVNSPDNIVPLCRNCHWEFDNGHLSLDEFTSAE